MALRGCEVNVSDQALVVGGPLRCGGKQRHVVPSEPTTFLRLQQEWTSDCSSAGSGFTPSSFLFETTRTTEPAGKVFGPELVLRVLR